MTIRTDLADQPNDRLLAALLHISGLAPLYKWQDQRRRMELVSAVLYLDAELMPAMTSEQTSAAIEWAAAKCSIKAEQVSIAPMPGDPAPEVCAECGADQGKHDGMRLGMGVVPAHDYVSALKPARRRRGLGDDAEGR